MLENRQLPSENQMAITVDIKHRQSPVHIEYFPFQTAPTLNSIKTENYIKVFYVGFICLRLFGLL